jgi:CRP/FNR family cyclic AMP-dependent transcriptional regulator
MAGWFRRSSSRGSAEEYARLLGQVPLFVDLGRRDLVRLGAVCRQREYAAGETLVRQGEAGAGLYVIISGRVRVTQRTAEGAERDLGPLGPGEVFGEMALLDDMHRSATVTATAPTRVLILPIFDFRTVLREDPDIVIRLLAVLSRRLRRAEQHQI